ncbi:methyltransferase [Prochlorococcus marinus str. XMU1401]|uniref:Class I SAM-dependent methyltransferase n=1 Tax=Prochlorococcus marinus str. XMU1401 TaxID=2052594 RepID=A0A8I1X4F0_PROMR|nr:class I SAM-dependent methyltransferase [Prochlorococcus marinus]MBO8223304.1 class I SAM-dependent methyltransferase [Prochlorococcus marinus str. XMU1401]MBW3059837.1 methyltransferase [Prochlorococcus marinus str. XMU1401E]MCQ9198938.1 class I SAM-dependent methyltransferase [Prochlorococcus marinus XMU1429]PJC83650.1 methyltransferase [Prochlorococcus marinus str. XMU1401]
MNCRVSGLDDLKEVINLGDQHYTGYFPKSLQEEVPTGNLSLGISKSSNLLQMMHSFNPEMMYGDNYGYRSGLNQSMVQHLEYLSNYLQSLKSLDSDDVVLDIGSNDGTFLNSIKIDGIKRIGIDPSSKKFRNFYDKNIFTSNKFFSKDEFFSLSDKRASLVVSISMFYDLEDPVKFAKEVNECLSDDGIWFLEQSYMPRMLETISFDTICHEHYEYYSLSTLKNIIEKAGFYLADVIFNDINGGSFGVVCTKNKNLVSDRSKKIIDWVLDYEEKLALNTLKPYLEFSQKVKFFKDTFINLINNIKSDEATISGIGASTKGNVLLQYCKLDANIIDNIGDVNKNKEGCFTPGTKIPIFSEEEVLKKNPDYLLILPWHFKNFFMKRFEKYRLNGGKLIFPLPNIQIL